MFPLSPSFQFPQTTFSSNTFWQNVRGPAWLILFAVAFAGMNQTLATDPPLAPRSATPYVRPTQYHLLPPAKPKVIERVRSVEDLVPVLDETPMMSLTSGPIDSGMQPVDFQQTEWPDTEATHGRNRFGNVPAMPETIGAFRPARVPSKYAETWPSKTWPEKTTRTQQFAAESVAGGDESRGGIRTSLFQAIRNPFVTQPVTNPVTQVNHSPIVPLPDRLTSPSVPLTSDPGPQSTAAVPYESLYPSEIHPAGCPCESCQAVFHQNSGTVFGSRPTAIVSKPETTFRLDALIWWSNSSSLPALATTNPAGTALDVAGALNTPGTASVFNDHAFAEAAPGYRFQIDHDFEGFGGIDFEFLQLGTRSESLNASSAEFPILGRPFTELLTNDSSASVIAFPAQSTGAIQVAMDSRFRTAAAHYYQLAMEESSRSTDDLLVAKFLIGPRIASLQESLWTQDRSSDLINGSLLQRTDSLRTENLFVGGEIGMLLNRRFKYVDLTAGLSLAMGANRQKFRASGNSVLTDSASLTTTTDSGWLNSSLGPVQINRNRFSVIPSAEFGVGFETQWGWRLSFGYDVMLWTNALRATEQLDSQLDTTFGGGPGAAVRPFPSLKNDSYLAHGVSFGMERRW